MRSRINSTLQTGLFLLLVAAALTVIGCGGNKSTASSSSANPTPTPTTSASSGTLTATPSSLGFGSQVLNTPATQTVKITNTGGSAVTITQGTVSGTGFSLGITTPLTLNAAQSVNVPVVFTPGTSGTTSGSLVLTSNGITVLSVPLSGTGLAALAHSVDITWAASTSTPLQGYNVYRSTVTGGPYSKLSATLSPTTLLFTDTTPVSGKKYFYVVTALNTSGAESAASSEVAVTIPVP
ncbi:MAG TPA: hypothetical protein VHA06_05315 [Candidatus Angelobacter sp.]|nr:hypothetical protein [Candidatus Angelobacter sp.]